MKALLVSLVLTLSSLSAFADCKVEEQLAPVKPVILFDNQRANFTIALAEAKLWEEAGAVCTEVEKTQSSIRVRAYNPILSGPYQGLLLQVIKIYTK